MIDLAPIIVTAIFALLGVFGALIVFLFWDNYDSFPQFVGASLILAAIVATALAWFPYNMDYKTWVEKGGTVQTIETRLMSDGDGMTENFVVTFEGEGQPYRCDDTRCALVKPGDTLILNCKKVWQWASTHGWECRFRDHEARP